MTYRMIGSLTQKMPPHGGSLIDPIAPLTMLKRQSTIRVIVRPRDLTFADHVYTVTTSSGPWSKRWQSTFDRIVNRETLAADSVFLGGWRTVLVERIA